LTLEFIEQKIDNPKLTVPVLTVLNIREQEEQYERLFLYQSVF